MSLYKIVDHLHSSIRWVLIILFALALYRLFVEGYRKGNKNARTLSYAKFTVIVSHIQVLLGLVLYFFLSPKVYFTASAMKSTFQRFYLVEHISMMLIAVILLTIAWVRGKKKLGTDAGARYLFVWFALAFVIILIAIPWPFRSALGGGWF